MSHFNETEVIWTNGNYRIVREKTQRGGLVRYVLEEKGSDALYDPIWKMVKVLYPQNTDHLGHALLCVFDEIYCNYMDAKDRSQR